VLSQSISVAHHHLILDVTLNLSSDIQSEQKSCQYKDYSIKAAFDINRC